MKKEKKIRKRVLCILLSFLFCLGTVCSVSAASLASEDAAKLAVLKGKTAGVLTGTPQDQIVQENIEDADLQYFSTATDLALALQTKKIDFFAISSVNYYNMADQYPEFAYIDVPLAEYNVGTVFPKTEKGDELREELNEYIAKIKENGELTKLQEYWLYPNDWQNIDLPTSGERGILKLATPNTLIPFSFMLHDKNVGFDIAIIAGFCREYGYGLSIDNVDFAGALSGITTGKYDLAAGQISWTAERAESVNYSDFYYVQKIVAIVNADEIDSPYLVRAAETEKSGIREAEMQSVSADGSSGDAGASLSADGKGSMTPAKRSLGERIQRTLIDENRWISILHGLLVTMVITLGGFLLANLLGALFCAMSLSKKKGFKLLSGIYSGLMQGLPIVVILMILYYVVFAHSKISNILVAVIGFGLVFGAYMAQLFEAGIAGVDRGQTEAALAIGFTKRQAFRFVVIPQAARAILPSYFSNLISMMKGTAVVGYIAVTDLTRVGDIIRSNTYEAIIPLLTIAAIYFLMTLLIFLLMSQIKTRLFTRKGRSFLKQEKGNKA